jgi:hypothetical protein
MNRIRQFLRDLRQAIDAGRDTFHRARYLSKRRESINTDF